MDWLSLFAWIAGLNALVWLIVLAMRTSNPRRREVWNAAGEVAGIFVFLVLVVWLGNVLADRTPR